MWQKPKISCFFPVPSLYHIVPHIINNIKSPKRSSFLSPYFDCVSYHWYPEQNTIFLCYQTFAEHRRAFPSPHNRYYASIAVIFQCTHLLEYANRHRSIGQLKIGHRTMKIVK